MLKSGIKFKIYSAVGETEIANREQGKNAGKDHEPRGYFTIIFLLQIAWREVAVMK